MCKYLNGVFKLIKTMYIYTYLCIICKIYLNKAFPFDGFFLINLYILIYINLYNNIKLFGYFTFPKNI